MSDYASLNVGHDTKARLMEHKQHPKDTQDDVLNHVLDLAEGNASDTDAQLDRIEAAARGASEAAQSAEKAVEELQR